MYLSIYLTIYLVCDELVESLHTGGGDPPDEFVQHPRLVQVVGVKEHLTVNGRRKK